MIKICPFCYKQLYEMQCSLSSSPVRYFCECCGEITCDSEATFTNITRSNLTQPKDGTSGVRGKSISGS